MDQEIIKELEENLDEFVSYMVERYRKRVASHWASPFTVSEETRQLVNQICLNFIYYLKGEGVADGFLEDLRRLAIAQENRGFELTELINTMNEGRETAWRFFKGKMSSNKLQGDLLEALEALDDYYNKMTSTITENYLLAQRESITSFNRMLNKFRVLLSKGELLDRITSEICREMGYSRAVFFIHEQEALLPVSAFSAEDENWGRIYMEPMRYYPISPFGSNLESRSFFGERLVTVGKMDLPLPSFILVTPPPKSAFALVPVNPAGSSKGLLYVEGGEEQILISDREIELLKIYADTIGLALENVQLYREVFLKGRALDHLMSKVNTAHEEERSRIARELHDSVAQMLLKIIYSTGFALDFLKEDPGLAVEEMEEVQAQAKECLRELRAIMANLRPSSLEILGLKETIMRYAEQFEEEYGIETVVDLSGMEKLSRPAELAIFRILQEALTNIRKHSGAGRAEIISSERNGQLQLVIRDNGKGFDLSEVESEQERGRHLGLLAMKERAELIGGYFQVDSNLGLGTVITIQLPLISKG